METNIQTSAEYLANLCLENGEIHHKYNDNDLMNATLIFNHFLLDVIYSENKHLNKDEMLALAETTGKAVRELIKISSGKDMHLIAKN